MIASSWLRKVSNTCSSHARRSRFKAVDNGSLLRITKAELLRRPGLVPDDPQRCILFGAGSRRLWFPSSQGLSAGEPNGLIRHTLAVTARFFPVPCGR
jgi:hypothetical protein